MAFSATSPTNEVRSFSLGPLKAQQFNYTAASGDTSGTVTADRLSSIVYIEVGSGVTQTAAATFSGNVATLTFADPAATIFGGLTVYGK